MNRDRSAKKENSSNNAVTIILRIGFVALAFIVITVTSSGSIEGRKKNVKAAEKYANHQVYLSLGVTPEKLKSEVVYKSDGKYLVVVKYWLNSANYAGGSICVYCENGIVYSSTSVMPPDYDYEKNINSLKAFFGI